MWLAIAVSVKGGPSRIPVLANDVLHCDRRTGIRNPKGVLLLLLDGLIHSRIASLTTAH